MSSCVGPWAIVAAGRGFVVRFAGDLPVFGLFGISTSHHRADPSGPLFLELAAGSTGSGDVGSRDVVGDHAIGAEPPPEGADRALHAANPLPRQAIRISIVVQRDDVIVKDT